MTLPATPPQSREARLRFCQLTRAEEPLAADWGLRGKMPVALDVPCKAWFPCLGAYPRACLGCVIMEQRSAETVSDGYWYPYNGRGCVRFSRLVPSAEGAIAGRINKGLKMYLGKPWPTTCLSLSLTRESSTCISGLLPFVAVFNLP